MFEYGQHPPHFELGKINPVTIGTFPMFCAWIVEHKQYGEMFFMGEDVDASVWEVMQKYADQPDLMRRKLKASTVYTGIGFQVIDMFSASYVMGVFRNCNTKNYEMLLERFKLRPDRLIVTCMEVLSRAKPKVAA